MYSSKRPKKNDIRQTFLRVGEKNKSGTQNIHGYVFDQQTARHELASAIIIHEYPLSLVNHIGFRRFVNSLQPCFKIVSRNTIKIDILKIYDVEKSKVYQFIQKVNNGRVAIRTDMWTSSNNKKGFMVIIAHFEGDKLSSSDLLFNGSVLHMCCRAHILNLIVKDGLQVIGSGIERIRDNVVYWSASQSRIEKFEEAAKQLNIACTKKLSLDCRTRWNSTYLMLQVAISYKEVFSRAIVRERNLTSLPVLPTDEDWQYAIMVCEN
ncbi:hypothetical protein LIER_32626 [Lithospermum erythrorhizon]|uniref:Uncharacterized protein n=1 Tax=Lithospermum erythrorhizon TaxID=34254 RepID=A0AAV3RUC6_LITER